MRHFVAPALFGSAFLIACGGGHVDRADGLGGRAGVTQGEGGAGPGNDSNVGAAGGVLGSIDGGAAGQPTPGDAGGAGGVETPPAAGANPYGAGLFEDDGSLHPEFEPNVVTGRRITVDAELADNGTDDRAAIQAAIDGATFGDEVFLPDGVYNILSATDGEGAIMLKSGVNLRGASESGVVLKVNGPGAAEGILSAYAKDKNTEDIVVSNLSIVHAAGTFTNGIRIAKNTSFGSGVVRRVQVDHVTVKNANRRAFRVFCASEIMISNSTAMDMVSEEEGYGFEAMCEGGGKVNSRFIVFRNNRALGPKMRHGFIIQDHVHHSLIEGCLTTKNFFGAIELHANGEHHIEIRKNIIQDSLGAGIKIRRGAGGRNWVHENIIRGAQWGILIETEDNTIESNLLVGFARSDEDLFGIYASTVKGVVLQENVIEDNHQEDEDYSFCGLYIGGDGVADIRENVITRNQVGVCGPGAAAVDLATNQIKGNVEADVQR